MTIVSNIEEALAINSTTLELFSKKDACMQVQSSVFMSLLTDSNVGFEVFENVGKMSENERFVKRALRIREKKSMCSQSEVGHRRGDE